MLETNIDNYQQQKLVNNHIDILKLTTDEGYMGGQYLDDIELDDIGQS